MKPFFLKYKSITISWFMAFAIVLIGLSSFISNLMAKEYGEDKKKIEDIYFILIISAFIGARLSYVLMNLGLYKGNIGAIFKLTHYNLSLTGGLIVGLLTLLILSKKFKIDFNKLLKIFVIPFYFSMAIGIWLVIFDKFLVSLKISNNPMKVLSLSIIFLLAMIVELVLGKKIEGKYLTPIILAVTMGLYFII